MTRFISPVCLVFSLSCLSAACSDDPSSDGNAAQSSSGGADPALSGGSGGSSTTGGATSSDGGHAQAGTSTGAVNAGSTGGQPVSSGSGGAHPSTGGASGSGGAPSTGGATVGSGGAPATGGSSSTGGAASEVCEWQEGPSGTNGGLTCYWFAQGTAQDQTTCPLGYKTYCGYCGTETGERPQGDGQIWCPINDVVSTVANISTPHFVAIPMTPLAQGKNCGMCVEVTYMGRTITATVVDACPSCASDQHLDLNMSAAAALGMTEIMGMVESGVSWRVVGCPTTGDIQVSFNGGYQGQVYFQNLAFPIATASSGDRQATVNTGFWDFGMEMGGQPVTLTDVMGHTVTATVPTAPGSLGVQFDLTCQ